MTDISDYDIGLFFESNPSADPNKLYLFPGCLTIKYYNTIMNYSIPRLIPLSFQINCVNIVLPRKINQEILSRCFNVPKNFKIENYIHKFELCFYDKNDNFVTFNKKKSHSNINSFDILFIISECFTIHNSKIIRDNIYIENDSFITRNSGIIYHPNDIIILNICANLKPNQYEFSMLNLGTLINNYIIKYFKDYGDEADKLYNLNKKISKSLIKSFSDKLQPLKTIYREKLTNFEYENSISSNIIVNTGTSKLVLYPIIFAHLLMPDSIFFIKAQFKVSEELFLPDLLCDTATVNIDIIVKLLFGVIYQESFPTIRMLIECGSDLGQSLFVLRSLTAYFGIDVYAEYFDKIIELI